MELVQREFLQLSEIDEVFWQLNALWDKYPDTRAEGQVQFVFATTYIDSTVIRIRRLGDRDPRSGSLWRLLDLLRDHAEKLTRERYMTGWHKELKRHADEGWAYLAGTEHAYIPCSRFRDAIKAVKDFANKAVAHKQRQGKYPKLKYGDVRESVVAAFEVFEWVSTAVLASGAPLSAIHTAPWLRDLTVPWLPPNEEPPKYDTLDAMLTRRRRRRD
jgi:hypothetical protein